MHRRGTRRQATRREQFEARLKGPAAALVGPGSVALDIGSALTKVAVVGDEAAAPRLVVATPPAVAAALRSGRDADAMTAALAPFLQLLATRLGGDSPLVGASRTALLLVDAVANPQATALVARWLQRVSACRQPPVTLSLQAAALGGAFGAATGLVVDVGASLTRVVPVLGGVVVAEAVAVARVGVATTAARVLRAQLLRDNPAFAAHGLDEALLSDDVLCDLLATYAVVAPSPAQASAAASHRASTLASTYALPIKTLALRCRPNEALEALFVSDADDDEDEGNDDGGGMPRTVPGLVLCALRRCDALTQRPFVRGLVAVVGGGAAFPNFVPRLAASLLERAAAGGGDGGNAKLLSGLRFATPLLPCSPVVLAAVGAAVAAH